MPAEPGRRPVRATYRLQIRDGFDLHDARGVVPYLASLGVSDVYASPLLQARPGSTHGYDATTFERIDPALGGDSALEALATELGRHGMGLVLDFVPNHMAADPTSNLWWRDVLEHGPSSRYAKYFDVEWEPPQEHLRQKVLLPILGEPYGRALAEGLLRLELADAWVILRYRECDLPLEPRSLLEILRRASPAGELDGVVGELARMPPYSSASATEERARHTSSARERLHHLLRADPTTRDELAASLTSVDGDALHDLLEAQPYRLAFWRTASHEINYRRFFDVDGLVGVRMEDPEVFEAAHRLVARLLAGGRIRGLRLDHIDGLLDPREYLHRLRRAVAAAGVPDAYVVVEKILTGDEILPDDWPVSGTSGYDFLNDVGRLFVDPAGERALDRVYRRFTGESRAFPEIVHTCKRLVMEGALASELNVLTTRLERLAKSDRDTRDYTWSSLRDALEEVVACFPVYRTYVDDRGASPGDRTRIDLAIDRARRGKAWVDPSIFGYIREVLVAPATPAQRAFGGHLQQYTGPVEAKGLEDTAFYRYTRLLSLCEVGGDPGRFGTSPPAFHATNLERLRRWPDAMLATSTHDTKRGEDARARLHVLSEIPLDWSRHLFRWRRTNARLRRVVEGEEAPTRGDEYVFYQTLLAAWPPDAREPDDALVARVVEATRKAAREAKLRTSWRAMNGPYEGALESFQRGALQGPRRQRFLADFTPFARRLARLGAFGSLAQVALKIAAPGVPDLYQGSELWDLNLVDPDNRRPVDFGARERALAALGTVLDPRTPGGERERRVRELVDGWVDGRLKLLLTAAVLRLRARRPQLFLRGTYQPLAVDGPLADRVVAFARRKGAEHVVVAVPRLVARLARDDVPGLQLDSDAFTGTTLDTAESGPLRCVLSGRLFSGGRLRASDLFDLAPLALLASPEDGGGVE